MAVATDPIDLVFSGAQHKQLTEALEQAYPSYQQLEMMVRHRLDLNLQSVSSSFNKLNYVAFELIKSRQAAGELLRLVAAAQASQPNNPRLAAVASALGLAADAPPRAELEKIVKKTSVPFDIAVWRERMAAREVCVCRMEVPVAGGTSFGTGFLVGPDLVLTNHHVIDGVTDPAAIVVRFDYKARAGGGTISPGVEVHLAAEWLVDSSPHSPVDLEGLPKQGVPDPEQLDYALLRLADPVGDAADSGREGGRARRPATRLDRAADEALAVCREPIALHHPAPERLADEARDGSRGDDDRECQRDARHLPDRDRRRIVGIALLQPALGSGRAAPCRAIRRTRTSTIRHSTRASPSTASSPGSTPEA